MYSTPSDANTDLGIQRVKHVRYISFSLRWITGKWNPRVISRENQLVLRRWIRANKTKQTKNNVEYCTCKYSQTNKIKEDQALLLFAGLGKPFTETNNIGEEVLRERSVTGRGVWTMEGWSHRVLCGWSHLWRTMKSFIFYLCFFEMKYIHAINYIMYVYI